MNADLLLVGGEDHDLRIPFMLAMGACGFNVMGAGTGDPAPFRRAGIAYHGFGFDRFLNPLADMFALHTLRRLFAELRPRIVHSFDTKPNILAPLAARELAGTVVMRTINGLGWLFSSRRPLPLMLRPVYCSAHRRAARATALTVFQNRTDQSFFEQHGMIGRGRSQIIAGSGVDLAQFRQRAGAAPPAAALRRELGVGDAELVITVSRMTRRKGILTLLKAAALVHAIRPATRFVLVGPHEGEGAEAISPSVIAEHGPYVVATGKRSDVPALLGAADVFAFPTEYREGVPRALLEAALAGLPIVATSMPGCTDVIRDGWSGVLVPPRDPPRLAASIIALLEDRVRAREMAERAARLVADEFSLARNVALYASAYRELLRPGAEPSRCAG
ncbi:MAG: glycosyltransferase [Acetobacteraceae bacterium]|nr:glycosyltransferase [Acetobacteraceae bacterium]